MDFRICMWGLFCKSYATIGVFCQAVLGVFMGRPSFVLSGEYRAKMRYVKPVQNSRGGLFSVGLCVPLATEWNTIDTFFWKQIG
jgi:hypothetical protein